MKKLFNVCIFLLLVPSVVLAVPFTPTKLQLIVPETIHYDFNGTNLEIPVTVTGTSARLYFYVFTKGKGDQIGEVQNGYLGWHYVNNIDTCVFMSAPSDFPVGVNTLTWSGKDSDGGIVPPDEYTYYMWAYDYENPPETRISAPRAVAWRTGGDGHVVNVIEKEEDGTPKANPILADFHHNRQPNIGVKWILGNDPADSTLLETTDFQVPLEYQNRFRMPISPNPTNHNIWYYLTSNKDALVITVNRLTWVPNDLATLDSDWGFETAECFRYTPGILADDDYLYWSKNDAYSAEPCTKVYIMDYDANIVAQFQNDLWIKPDEYALGASQLNGGPDWHFLRNHYIVQGAEWAMQALGDPLRYLASNEYADFTRCFNQNGDYVQDRCSDPASPTPWLNFCESAPYNNCNYADANDFSVCTSNGLGTISIALFAPDYTGVHISYAGELGTSTRNTLFVDNGSAYDGMYVIGYTANREMGYVAHDSIKGTLTHEVGVADEAPTAFVVEQNSPNPANPNTTISFTLPESGTVTVDVYNVAGQKVDTLVNDFMESGRHSVVWDGSNFSTGVYFYTVTSGEYSRTMKMTLLK